MAEPTLLETIHEIDREIETKFKEIKTAKEALDDEILNTVAYSKLEKAREDLRIAQDELKLEIQSSREINTLKEQLGEHNAELKDLKDILSQHLIRYHSETDADQVPIGDGTRARQLVLTAKLGKEEYYQERMQFLGGPVRQ